MLSSECLNLALNLWIWLELGEHKVAKIKINAFGVPAGVPILKLGLWMRNGDLEVHCPHLDEI